jgi:hypothetical protein
MGMLKRLLASTAVRRPSVTCSPVWAQLPTLAPGATLEVVGESNHQPALERAAGGRTPDGCKRRLVTAELVREPLNKHDANAVRVDVGAETVGYVPREIAPQLHQVVETLWTSDRLATCRASLTGGCDRGWRDKGTIGIVLDMASPATFFDPGTMPALPDGQRVSVTNEEHYQNTLEQLLGRGSSLETISTLRVIDRDPHRSASLSATEVLIGSRLRPDSA